MTDISIVISERTAENLSVALTKILAEKPTALSASEYSAIESLAYYLTEGENLNSLREKLAALK